jgi:2-haloacid dehalogenase
MPRKKHNSSGRTPSRRRAKVGAMATRRRVPTRVLAFDVYGTLIDPFHMEEHLRAVFGERAKEATELWRSKQLEYSFRRALMRKYQNFDVCTAQALRFVYRQFGLPIDEESLQSFLEKYLQLPAYPDVPDALVELEARGFRLVACSNGTENSVRALLERAGVLSRFKTVMSVDPLRTFKPDPAVYGHLVARVRAKKEMVWLISSNPFDVIGAKACGLRTAWLQRDQKKVFDPWEFEPDLIVTDLDQLPGKLNFT